MVALMITPLITLFLIVFGADTKMPELYGIRETDLSYYFMFSIAIIPASFWVDVFVLNTEELAHGWKVFDYVAYQKYRFT